MSIIRAFIESNLTEHNKLRILRIDKELQRGIKKSQGIVQRHSKQKKLTGQVLKTRTNRLRGSIKVRQPFKHGGGWAGKVGTDVEYAAIHEYGFNGTVSVRAHTRSHTNKNKGKFTSFKFTSTGFPVRAHTRDIDMPERSFLRSALRDMRSRINLEISNSIKKALRI